MSPAPGTLEVNLRRTSVQSAIQKLEKTTGMFFNIRRARVTSKSAQCCLEIVGGTPALLPPAYL